MSDKTKQLPADYHSVEQSNKRLIESAVRDGAILQADDGYYVYWPSNPCGFLTSHMLRVIAAHLDTVNKPWDDEVAQCVMEDSEQEDISWIDISNQPEA